MNATFVGTGADVIQCVCYVGVGVGVGVVSVRVLKQPKYYLNVLHINHLIIAPVFSLKYLFDAIESAPI
jgi:hypothetical protein